MERLTIKAVVLSLPLLLTSCSLFVEEVASPIVASDIYHSVNNTKPVTKSADSKQKKKEQEKLIQAGKCPVCGGVGKSADGLYDCEACNGTGKYNDTENK
jgi:hypothetical protein